MPIPNYCSTAIKGTKHNIILAHKIWNSYRFTMVSFHKVRSKERINASYKLLKGSVSFGSMPTGYNGAFDSASYRIGLL